MFTINLKGNHTLLVADIYHPPSSSMDFVEQLYFMLQNNSYLNNVFKIKSGDFSLPFITRLPPSGPSWFDRLFGTGDSCGWLQHKDCRTRSNQTLALLLTIYCYPLKIEIFYQRSFSYLHILLFSLTRSLPK